jgi:soluble lytic murein transglycosylase
VANAVGLMQLIIPTGRAMARREGVSGTIDRNRLKDPLLNIRLGTRYLGRLSARFEGHPALIASGYNAGPGRPAQWLERDTTEELDVFVEKIPYRETRRYTKSVITSYLRYRFLYGNKESVQIPIDLPRQE